MDDSDLPMPISARAVDGHTWDTDETPWLKGIQSSTLGEPGMGYAQCLMCGAETLKLSSTDVWADTGRLTLYCDNMNCDAREMELVVTRDNGRALRRADVRALKAIDDGRPQPAPDPEAEKVTFQVAVAPWTAPDYRLEYRTSRDRERLEY